MIGMLKDALTQGGRLSLASAKQEAYKYFRTYQDPAELEKTKDILVSITKQDVSSKLADKNEKLMELDANGKPTGRFIDRADAHNKNNLKYHQEVAGIILNQRGEMLIIKRSSEKKSYPSCWGLTAGHVEGNETSQTSVMYEVSEEINTPYKDYSFVRIMDPTENSRADNKCFVTPYVVASNVQPNFLSFQESEVSGFQWVSLPDFKNMVENKHGEHKVIFTNNAYYQSLISTLEKLMTLPNWYGALQESDYKTIHKHLGIETTLEEIKIFKRKEIIVEPHQETRQPPLPPRR